MRLRAIAIPGGRLGQAAGRMQRRRRNSATHGYNDAPHTVRHAQIAPMPELPRFHLAFPVRDLAEARGFYGTLLGCREGRSSDRWVDFDFDGHQIVAHLAPASGPGASNEVDGEQVPVRHFGLILSLPEWRRRTEALRRAGVKFLIEPQIRFAGQVGEQATCFFLDPSGNALELKAFADDAAVFAR